MGRVATVTEARDRDPDSRLCNLLAAYLHRANTTMLTSSVAVVKIAKLPTD